MTQIVITDNLVDSLFDHPKFMERLKRVQEAEPFQKSNELTKSECSQMETSAQSIIDSELIVQEISILLLENMNKQIDEQLKNQISLSNWFFKEIRQIKNQLNMVVQPSDQENQLKQKLRQLNVKDKKGESENFNDIFTKKQHEEWARDLINQINGCINSGMANMESTYKKNLIDLENKIDGKLQKNLKTINDLHNIIQPRERKVDLKIINQKQVKKMRQKEQREKEQRQKNKEKQTEKEGQKKLQLSKSLESLGSFFKIKQK